MSPRIYITLPSYASTGPTDRAKYLAKAKQWAELFGWEIIASPLLDRFQGSGSWAPAELRAEDMRRALQHEIVWAARGGYGAVELVPSLLQAEATGTPLLIGYSDNTVLHAIWTKREWGYGIYGTLADTLDNTRQAESLRAFFSGGGYRVTHTTEAAGRVLRSGTSRAPIFSACLVVLANLCGTAAMPPLQGRILAIEDIGERPYGVDFALYQLYLSGALHGIAGLLGGAFHHTPPDDYGGPTVDEILAQWAERLQVPCVSRLPFGHLDDQMVMLNGVQAELEAAADGRWSLTWDAQRLV